MVKRTRWTDMDKSDTPFSKLRAAYVVFKELAAGNVLG